MKKYYIVFALLMMVPMIVSASWYNPTTWDIFSFIFGSTSQVQIASTTTLPNQIPQRPLHSTEATSTTPTTAQLQTLLSAQSTDNRSCADGFIFDEGTSKCLTPLAYCQNQNGSNATYNSADNICGCADGYSFDKSTNKCVTPLAYCQNRRGSNATYSSVNNSCGCAEGYTLNSNNICTVPKTGYQVCNDMNATWDGTSYISSGVYNCSCKSGYTSASDRKSCVVTPPTQTQQQTDCLANTNIMGASLSDPTVAGQIMRARLCTEQQVEMQIATLQQQILNIKAKYYQDISGVQNDTTRGVPESVMGGNIDKLTNAANAQINQINQQIQQLNSGINTLDTAIPASQQTQSQDTKINVTNCQPVGGNGVVIFDCNGKKINVTNCQPVGGNGVVIFDCKP